jgi:hypothetical protein
MKNSKRIIAAILCCLCLLGAARTGLVAAEASDGTSGFQPYWSTLSTITLSLSYSGGKVNWGGSISGNSNVTSINATYTLYRLNANNAYTYVNSWNNYGSQTYLNSSGSQTAAAGTYRLTVEVTATTSSGTTESVSSSLSKTLS